MTKITDPELIAQLESEEVPNQAKATKVTDPAILAQLNDNKEPSPYEKEKYFAKGAINSLGNSITGGANMADYANPAVRSLMGLQSGETGFGEQQPIPEEMQGAYDTGHTVGTVAGLIPAGYSAVKIAAPIAKTLAKPAVEFASSFRAAKPLADAEGIADLLKKAHSEEGLEAIEEPIVSGYKKIFDKFGKHNVYEEAAPSKQLSLEDMASSIEPKDVIKSDFKYSDIDPSQLKGVYSSKLKLQHNRFIEDPTLQNAQHLKRQLGDTVRALDVKNAKSGLDVTDLDKKDSYVLAKELLENDMRKFMKTRDPELADLYDKTNLDFATKIVPRRNVADLLSTVPDEGGAKDVLKVFKKATETPKGRSKYNLPEDVHEDIGSIKKLLEQHEANAKRAKILKYSTMGLGGAALGAGGHAMGFLKSLLGG